LTVSSLQGAELLFGGKGFNTEATETLRALCVKTGISVEDAESLGLVVGPVATLETVEEDLTPES
jgi:hypothetical protein